MSNAIPLMLGEFESEAGLLYIGDELARIPDELDSGIVTPHTTCVMVAVPPFFIAGQRVLWSMIVDNDEPPPCSNLIWSGEVACPSGRLTVGDLALEGGMAQILTTVSVEQRVGIQVIGDPDLEDQLQAVVLRIRPRLPSLDRPSIGQVNRSFESDSALAIRRTFAYGLLEIVDSESSRMTGGFEGVAAAGPDWAAVRVEPTRTVTVSIDRSPPPFDSSWTLAASIQAPSGWINIGDGDEFDQVAVAPIVAIWAAVEESGTIVRLFVVDTQAPIGTTA